MKRKPKEASNKSEGIYYIVCINGKWKVEAFRTDQYGDIDHVRIWEEHLAPYLARIFKLNKEDASLLKLSYAGFPRGRVIKILLVKMRFLLRLGSLMLSLSSMTTNVL